MSQPAPPARVAVIIVNYNAGPDLARCIQALQRQTRPPDRCLLVDNASREAPLTGGESWLSGVELLRQDRNLGFAAANNLAIRQCSGIEWIALLNPDAWPAPDWLERLMEAAATHPAYASFACRQLDAEHPDRLDGAGDSLTTGGRPFRRGHGQPAAGQRLESDEVFSACGAAALYRRSALVAAGGFDADFFCYLEDVDLGFRLRLAGHRCRYAPAAVVWHRGSASAGRQSAFYTYHGHRNMLWVFVKNLPGALFWLYLPQHLLISLAGFAVCARRGQAGIFLSAKRDALRALPVMLGKRRAIQRQRTASLASLRAALTSEWDLLTAALRAWRQPARPE